MAGWGRRGNTRGNKETGRDMGTHTQGCKGRQGSHKMKKGKKLVQGQKRCSSKPSKAYKAGPNRQEGKGNNHKQIKGVHMYEIV